MSMTQNDQMQRLLRLTRVTFNIVKDASVEIEQTEDIDCGEVVSVKSDIELILIYRTSIWRGSNGNTYKPMWAIGDGDSVWACEPFVEDIVIAAVTYWIDAKARNAMRTVDRKYALELSRDTADALAFLRDLNAMDSEVA